MKMDRSIWLIPLIALFTACSDSSTGVEEPGARQTQPAPTAMDNDLARCIQVQPEQFEYVTDLDFCPLELATLNGIGQLPNLQSLRLYFHADLASLEPLRGHKNLQTLDIWTGKIADIDVLSTLPALKDVALSDLPLNNIEVIRQMPQLEALALTRVSLDDYSPITAPTNLKSLSLSASNFTDWRLIDSHVNLESLSLRRTPLCADSTELYRFPALRKYEGCIDDDTDLMNLASLTNLSELTLSAQGNTARNWQPLSALDQLSKLHLEQGKHVNLNEIASNYVSELVLGNNGIVNMSGLVNFPNLTSLRVYHETATDYSALQSLVNITTLDLSESNIADVRPLIDLPNLQHLALPESGVENCQLLASLELVTLSGCGY